MKFLFDMNLSPRWIGFLESHGYDAVHWSQCGSPNARDRDILKWAVAAAKIVVTSDLDFSAILAASGERQPSVIQIRGDRQDPDTIGATLLTSIRHAEADLRSGALLTIDTNRSRLRILPLIGE